MKAQRCGSLIHVILPQSEVNALDDALGSVDTEDLVSIEAELFETIQSMVKVVQRTPSPAERWDRQAWRAKTARPS